MYRFRPSIARPLAADTFASRSSLQSAVQGRRQALSRSPQQGVIGSQWGKFFSLSLLSTAVVMVLATPAYAGKPTSKKGNANQDNTSTVYTPMAVESENYNFRNLSGDNSCLGEDDAFTWEAIGGLQPGESFTFTPQYPGCKNHPAAISVALAWQGSQLALSSNVPDQDFASADASQQGKQIIAPTVGESAQLCMFPQYRSDDSYYTITVTNVGTTTANNVVVNGRSDNDWSIHYYSRCLNADADGDGWNDSLEHSMANLVYPKGYIDGIYQPYILWGSNYLKATADTSTADDEIDSFPVDFNDDGRVDNLDMDELIGYLGEGNGIPLGHISPNPSDAEYYWNNTFDWRRYDLDGDGLVSQTDVDIVSTLSGQPLPMQEDIIAPTARVVSPADGGSVASGNYYLIKGHAWDNAAIERVEYLANGRVLCSVTDPVPSFGYTSPFQACWWDVPKRKGVHELQVRVYDAAGQVTTSDTAYVTAN